MQRLRSWQAVGILLQPSLFNEYQVAAATLSQYSRQTLQDWCHVIRAAVSRKLLPLKINSFTDNFMFRHTDSVKTGASALSL